MRHSSSDDLARLRRIPGLRDVASRELSSFLAHAHPISFQPDVAVVREGEQADCAFLLVDGACRVEVRHGDGVRQVGTLRPGAVLGEVGLFCSDARRSATVRTETPVRLLLLTRDLLDAPGAQPVLRRLERRALGQVAERVRRASQTRLRIERDAAPPPAASTSALARLWSRFRS